MILEWSLEGFKCVIERQDLEFRPLTIFTGANSSGKSTVLQSILLLSQTLTSQVERQQILLNGDLVRLGTLNDVISQDRTDTTFSIGCRLKIDQKSFQRSRSIGRLPFSPWLWGRTRNSEPSARYVLGTSTTAQSSPKDEVIRVEIVEARFALEDDSEGFRFSRRSDEEVERLVEENNNTDYALSSPEGIRTYGRYRVMSEKGWKESELYRFYHHHSSSGEDPDVVGAALDHLVPQNIIVRTMPIRLSPKSPIPWVSQAISYVRRSPAPYIRGKSMVRLNHCPVPHALLWWREQFVRSENI